MGFDICDACGKSSKEREDGVTFHKCTEKSHARKSAWRAACCKNAGLNLPYKKTLVLCSNHFIPMSDFIFIGGRTVLKRDAVPSLFESHEPGSQDNLETANNNAVESILNHSPGDDGQRLLPLSPPSAAKSLIVEEGQPGDPHITNLGIFDSPCDLGGFDELNHHEVDLEGGTGRVVRKRLKFSDGAGALFEENDSFVDGSGSEHAREMDELIDLPDRDELLDRQISEHYLQEASPVGLTDNESGSPCKLDDHVNKISADGASSVTPQVLLSPSGSNPAFLSPDRQSSVSMLTPSPSRSALKRSISSLTKKHVNLMKSHISSRFSILRFLDSPKSIVHYTGFQNYQVFYSFFTFFYDDANAMRYLGSTKGKQNEDGSFRPRRLSTNRRLLKSEEFFLTLIRLRRNYDEIHLGHLFDLSPSAVSRITNTWILLMADRLRQLDIWPPSPPAAMLLVPDCLKDEFKDMITIVDGTEIYTQKPSASSAQKEIFSSYKSHTTAKFLVGIDGNGSVTFVSRAYAGRTSDKKLFKHCGIMDKLKEGDMVMADRGFDLLKDLDPLGIRVVIPDFKRGRTQFAEEQLEHSEKVALVRVHVERAILKIKHFEILNQTLPLTLMPMLDSIWFVCAILSNFTCSGALVKPK